MADSRGHGDERGSRGRQGQQTGSKRPRTTTGAAAAAPKKGDEPAKGTARRATAARSEPAKGGGMERSSKRPRSSRY